MSDPNTDLETRVDKAPRTRLTNCVKGTLDKMATGTLGAYGFVVLFALCPPVMLYCAGKGAVHGIEHSYHWVHDHLYAHDHAQT